MVDLTNLFYGNLTGQKDKATTESKQSLKVVARSSLHKLPAQPASFGKKASYSNVSAQTSRNNLKLLKNEHRISAAELELSSTLVKP